MDDVRLRPRDEEDQHGRQGPRGRAVWRRPTVGRTRPAICANGWVYWAEGRTNPVLGKPWLADIYGRELGSTAPARLIVENAYQATATDDWLYYQDWDREKGDVPGYAIHRRSLTDGRTELVHRDPKRDGGAFLAANGDVAAWTTSNDELLVYRDSTRIARVTAKQDHSTAWVTAGPDMIGFTTGDGAATNDLLLDLRDGCRLHRLAKAPGLAGVELAGGTIAWTVPDPKTGAAAWHYGRLN